MRDQSAGLRLAIAAVGGQAKTLAERLGISPQAVSQWENIPAERVIAIEKLTLVHRSKLRPDFYPPERRQTSHGSGKNDMSI
jgi:DNA-binding transcriptional regulator YdaS (Cro superfamily)